MRPILDYNIEFAHIYTNESFSSEQERGVILTLKKEKELEKQKYKVASGVLIDDYSPAERLLEIPDYLKKLEQAGRAPDFAGLEGSLTGFKNTLLDLVEKKSIKKEYVRYIDKKNGKIPCSFLIVVWYLLRLGLLDPSGDGNFLIKGSPNANFAARRLINILPERFRAVEERAKELLLATNYKSYVDNIEYIFF